MKKLLALLCTLLLSISLVSPAFAQEKVIESKSINEYQYIKELKQKSDIELKDMGLDDNQITELKNLDYGKGLKERSKLDKKILKNMGYSNVQIEQLQDFQGTEAEIIALAASVNLNVENNGLTYDSALDRSYWTVSFDWSWSSEPFWLLQDIIGSGWSPDFSLVTSTSSSYQKVRYKRNTTGATWTSTKPFTLSNLNCAQSSFAMSGGHDPNWDWYDWADSGSGYVKVTKAGKVRDMQMRIAYGHSQITTSNPSLGYPWGIYFTFSSSVNQEASKTIQYYY
ncbi:hypothetical protein [Desulfosporosinus youngiae]|uniref:Uncharacterized protein n=1 Tax=Desulfosporosinus youngiae DSM 17734 TaxID=768710 RepID=H5XTJ1_9FIRM|nr:hypothetical protein [Desulfosporosinus youngiae]EHQ88590.1 hypothetical protein DesyoDRAFT_1433 [Desulfosporosinus youngiae DSM 17734]